MLCVTRKARSCADRCGEDRNVLRVGKLACAFAVVCRGAMERFEERRGLSELGGQIPSDLRHGSLGKYKTKEAKLAENDNRVAGARADSNPSGFRDCGYADP
jgi:hypothetical protein